MWGKLKWCPSCHRKKWFEKSKKKCKSCRIDKAEEKKEVEYGIPPEGALIIYFDGGCWPNPGGIASYGWHVDDPQGNRIAQDCGRVIHTPSTNNVAEWRALEQALRWIVYVSPQIPPYLLIRGDSQLVIYQLIGKWGCYKQHLEDIRNRCQELLQKVPFWTARWIPRKKNAVADSLAYKGANS